MSDDRPSDPGFLDEAEKRRVAEPDPAAEDIEITGYRLRYQEAFEFAADGQLSTDAHGIILEANHAAAALLRCPKEFLIDKPLGLFVVPGHRSRFYLSLSRFMVERGVDEFDTCVGRGNVPRDVAVRAMTMESRSPRQTIIRWILRDITERKRNEAARVELIGRLVTAQEDERRRIARELHDEMGQHLTALILDLKLAGDRLSIDSPVRERLERARRAAAQIGHAIHRLAVALRPTALDDLGLDATIRNHVAEWSRITGIQAGYRGVGPSGPRLDTSIETALYRIMQEALTNVAKHANASRVSVILERKGGSLRLIVEDNGRGFNPDRINPPVIGDARLGLLGMQERVEMVGGSLVIETEPGGPTSIFVEIPCDGGGEEWTDA